MKENDQQFNNACSRHPFLGAIVAGSFGAIFILALVAIGAFFVGDVFIGMVALIGAAISFFLWKGLHNWIMSQSERADWEAKDQVDRREHLIKAYANSAEVPMDIEREIQAVLGEFEKQDPRVAQSLRKTRIEDPEIDTDLLQIRRMIVTGKSDAEIEKYYRGMIIRSSERSHRDGRRL